MRIFLRRGVVKSYFPCLPRHISSLLVFVFLFASIASIGASVVLWSSVAEAQGSEKAILHRNHPLVQEAIGVQHRHLNRLMRIRGVVGTGVGIGTDGLPAIKVFTARHGVKGIPKWLESTPVHVEVTGRFYALRGETCDAASSTSDGVCTTAEKWPLPVPTGVSVGHPDITAGTIAARVTDGTTVYVLSNNHILANVNQASIGDPVLQPGTYDGGTDDDAIANLTEFESIKFCNSFFGFLISCPNTNTIDAAIAVSTSSELGFSTPVGEFNSVPGYGVPSSTLHPAYGDPGVVGDENLADLLGAEVQKYGRTTGLTTGTVNTINATVDVCYDGYCLDIARFTDQLFVTPGNFSAGGDSGSLVVDSQRRPVGLLFAGSDTLTIINRIDLVLNRFGVTIDGGDVVEPAIDVATTAIDVDPTPVVVDQEVTVTVTVQNRGQLPVSNIDVTLNDVTGGVPVGANQITELRSGESATVGFLWIPTTDGSHTLEASLENAGEFFDEVEANNSISTTVMVKDQAIPTSVHIADLDGKGSKGKIWTATVTITVEDDFGQPVPGAWVHGTFSDGPSDFKCLTDGSGTCSVVGYQWVWLYKCLTYTMTGVDALLPYSPSDNRDPDGGNSNGTSITVCRGNKVF